MLFVERFAAGRSMNSLVAGLGRQGADISPATLAGTCAQAGTLLAPLGEAITARSRDSWHLHTDETTWRVFAPREGDGPARWWLWVFIGPDTVCFVMDPTRSGAVLARHAGIDEDTGQLTGTGRGGWSSPATSTPCTSQQVTELGYEHLRRHDLRHTGLTWMFRRGRADSRTAQDSRARLADHDPALPAP
jgi:hypothetical protein